MVLFATERVHKGFAERNRNDALGAGSGRLIFAFGKMCEES